MSMPKNKNEIISYIKRKLGGDFVPIEISDDQFSDVVDYSISFFREYVADFTQDLLYLLQTGAGTLEYTLPSNIIAVAEILDKSLWQNIFFLFPSEQLSSAEIGFIVSLGKLGSGWNFVDMEVQLQNLSMFKKLFVPRIQFQYNRFTHKLQLYSDPAGSRLGILATTFSVDESTTSEHWANKLFLDYVEANALRQWGRNLSKFANFNLPGGGSVNGEKMLADSEARIKELEGQVIEMADSSSTAQILIG